MLRLVEAGSFMRKELVDNILLTSRELLGHHCHIRQVLVDIDQRFLKNSPNVMALKTL